MFGGIDGAAEDAIGVHVLPSFASTNNRNMVNTRFSLDGTNYAEVIDPNSKLIYKFVSVIEAAGIQIVSGGTITGAVSMQSPIVYGGSGTTSTLTLKSTTSVGTTGADIIFQVGNNGGTEAA